MIPYFQFTSFQLGPLTIQVWGLLVAIGFLAGGYASAWMAKRRGLNPQVVWDMLGWIILGAMVGARLFHVLFYDPSYYLANPLDTFKIWQGGLSSVGGFLGAFLIGLWRARRMKIDPWKYADAGVFGLPLGYGIGRIGCFLIHDHPGTATDFFLGVKYPDGVVRHDLGLYQAIDGFVLFAIFLILAKRKAPSGTYPTVFLIWYGVTRFFLDFLRATSGPVVDVRYAGLTPAQYASIAMVIAGCFVGRKYRRSQKLSTIKSP